jgi:hypothetical protein
LPLGEGRRSRQHDQADGENLDTYVTHSQTPKVEFGIGVRVR